jgi:peptidoglycan/xylan/chitin deacetylase (PgdA/CDA1 family)
MTPTATNTPIPLPTPDGVVRQAILPILMYHYVSDPPPDAGPLRRDLSVSPTAFEAQLRYFREAGYTSVTLYDLVMYLQIGQPLPPRPILFTFDDGYSDHYHNAFPLLKRYGFVGTFFVITGFADERRPEYLSWDQVREMGAAGMEFGAHSYTHPDLRDQSMDYLVWQTLGPKQALEERVTRPVIAFCYPFGWYDEQTIRVIESAGYWIGMTTQQGMLHRSDERYEIKRVRVRGSDTVRDLANRIDYLGAEAILGVPTPTPVVSPTPIYHPTTVFQPRQGYE